MAINKTVVDREPRTFIEQAIQIKERLLTTHDILDSVIGTSAPDDEGDAWKQPDDLFSQLYQLLSDNLHLSTKLAERLSQLKNKVLD
jgi:hypothetical protein